MGFVRPVTVLFALGLVLGVITSAAWAVRRPIHQNQIRTLQTGHLISINHAGQDTLSVLPGIGRTMARRIIDFRESHGRFKSVDELILVPGIGSKTLRRLRSMIRLSEG